MHAQYKFNLSGRPLLRTSKIGGLEEKMKGLYR